MEIAKHRTYFPWLSLFTTAFVCLYFYSLTSSNIEISQLIPVQFKEESIKEASLLVLSLIFLLDYLRFSRNKKTFNRKLRDYDKHVKELLRSKNNLQTKALKYSDHADKLKLFISDRLLEHIEYDEKFLHFKNIASEVRHNGVISYDKVKTALETAISESNLKSHAESKDEKNITPIYSEALISMRYLWDLLDLSTTDNIALYVANKLYEAEERYFQQVLENNLNSKSYSPTFYAYDAVIASLPDFVDKTQITHTKNKSRRKIVHYSDNKLWLELEKNVQLLGNMNYFVLLIENLINNALFYLNKKNYGNKYARISVSLKKSKKNAILSIYNPGPIIDDSVKDKIFELGFSTRRNKENNGKGLGLYFVNQIAKGNEGDIHSENIFNRSQSFSLKIEIDGKNENGNIVEDIKINANDNKHLVCEVDAESVAEIDVDTSADKTSGNVGTNGTNKTKNVKLTAPFLEYKLKKPVTRVSVIVQPGNKEYTLEDIEDKQDGILFDPEHPEIPRWCIEYFKLKTMNKVVFRPLNVTGVRFAVTVPTAESRLEVDYHELESEEINKLENPDVDFDNENRDLYR